MLEMFSKYAMGMYGFQTSKLSNEACTAKVYNVIFQ